MLSNKIRLLVEGLFIILALLLGSVTMGSLLAMTGKNSVGEEVALLHEQGVIIFFVFLLFFGILLHCLLKVILRPLVNLPLYLSTIAKRENYAMVTGTFPGSDDITREANNLANIMDLCQGEKAAEKRKLKLIMDNMDNGVALVDEEGMLLEGNKPFFSLFPLAEKAEKRETGLFKNPQFSNFLRARLVKNDTGEFILRTKAEGEQKVLQVFGAPLTIAFRGDPSRVLLVFHDITLLQQVYERQTAFVSNASHELATPLTAIKGFAETLAGDENMDEATRNKFLNIIVTESNRMQVLLKDLLQLAKLDSGEYRKNVTIEALPTEGLLEELEMEFSPALATRKLHMAILYEDKPVLKTNKEWLKQILVNLLENALKYTPLGGNIKVTLSREKDRGVFTLFNSGEGLRAEDKEKIFARFYRSDASHNHKVEGSGLGLSIVKFAVEMLGGTIRVESVQGQGVSFIFTMPLV